MITQRANTLTPTHLPIYTRGIRNVQRIVVCNFNQCCYHLIPLKAVAHDTSYLCKYCTKPALGSFEVIRVSFTVPEHEPAVF